MIKIYTNSLGEGDWVKVYRGNSLFYEGHSIGLFDFVGIIQSIGGEAEVVECTDSELENYGVVL